MPPSVSRCFIRFDRDLLKALCRIVHECLLEFMRTILDLPDGLPGIVMAIHPFGERLDFHPYLRPLVPTVCSCARACFMCCRR